MNAPSTPSMRKQKERVKCRVCSAPVSSRNCDKSIGFSHKPVEFQSNEETGRTDEEKLEEVENRLRNKGWNL